MWDGRSCICEAIQGLEGTGKKSEDAVYNDSERQWQTGDRLLANTSVGLSPGLVILGAMGNIRHKW